MALFNKKRESSISSKRIARYLAYAVGEIVLVVIGILIAVSINDWQEEKKEKALLKSYLLDFRNDLIVDSTNVGANLRLLEEKEKGFKMVLSDTLEKEDLMANPITFNLILTYNPIRLQTKGYNELSGYVNQNESKQDTLVQQIVAEHQRYNDLLETTMENITKDVSDNMDYLKNNKPWIGKLMTGKIEEEAIAYFLSSDYQNRVAIHGILVFGNLQRFLQLYQNYIEGILPRIDQRLASIS